MGKGKKKRRVTYLRSSFGSMRFSDDTPRQSGNTSLSLVHKMYDLVTVLCEYMKHGAWNMKHGA